MTKPAQDVGPEEELQDVLRQVHIYEALVLAAGDAHAVLDVMLTAEDPGVATRALVERYAFTDVQAWAVTELQFRRMTATDRKKVEQRLDGLRARVAALQQHLGRD